VGGVKMAPAAGAALWELYILRLEHAGDVPVR
jgi:hypothetical protein